MSKKTNRRKSNRKKTGRKNVSSNKVSHNKNQAASVAQKKRLLWLIPGAVILLAAVILLIIFLNGNSGSTVKVDNGKGIELYKEKISLLRTSALTEETIDALDGSPAGEQAGQAVFISICDKENRASVFTGVGSDLETAWNDADNKVLKFLEGNIYDPEWVKADAVYTSETVDTSELAKRVIAARHEFFRYGIAFDPMYKTALLEAELNGAKIYAYDDRETGLDFTYLNNYLEKAGRKTLSALPQEYTLFQCYGWFCDDDNQVYPLINDGLDYGRRDVELIDADYAEQLLRNAGYFLVNQVNPDGSFIYGLYPRFDNEIDNYNTMRHAGTLWSMVCLYRVTGDESLVEVVDLTIDYLLNNYIVYEDEDTAYLYEEKSDEIKIGGNGVTIIALSEYMDVFQNTKYLDLCRKLGNGILSLHNEETGEYYHVLNGDFSRKEEYRTVYYDGECTFALCRLYDLTGEDIWLDAARSAVDHFIEADYTQYKDHWVAYSLNEITKHVSDPEYYTFALRNAQENLKTIYERDTTYHTYLELLMSSFELYDRMVANGIESEYLNTSFSIEELLKTIYTRADRMLNGYFYPEYAMYMKNPQRILNTFMVRHDGYRIRIDDVQHNIGAYYKYFKNYDIMVSYGLLENLD